MENREISYSLTRAKTWQQTGFFVADPEEALTLDETLALLIQRPQDDFLHQYALAHISKLPLAELNLFIRHCQEDKEPVCLALVAEYLFLTKGRKELENQFSSDVIQKLSQHTPLIYLRSFLEPDQELHGKWSALFKANLLEHQPLPPLHETGLPPLLFKTKSPQRAVTIAELYQSFTKAETTNPNMIPPGQTADIAIDRLEKAGISMGQLMRHESSLSPIGLLRTWQFATHIENHRNRFLLSGEQTSYGRGLSLDTARASLMMEIVERCSAFVSVSECGLENYQNEYPIRYARFSEFKANNSDTMTAIDPSKLALEVSYQDQPLHWVCGHTPQKDPNTDSIDSLPVWVPVQCLFLFCNLDEPSLFSGLGSTGLASGNTLAQAKVAALLEIVERHQVATVPYDRSTCFHLVARDPQIASLLAAYRQAGINIWFQDITPANGIPCCRCFAVETTGEVHIGAAAHLDARRAIISAITETTCPFPNAPPTKPAPLDLALVGFENLPDYSTNDATVDLALLESLFIQNNCRPCYIDLTRADIGLPVVKAIVPGREILGDFDDYSRIHPELYRNYLSLLQNENKHKHE